MLKNEGKRFFLIATDQIEKRNRFKEWIEARFVESVVYTANDYMECLIKIKNAPPNILITDFTLNKGRPGQIVDTLVSDQQSKVAIVALGSTPKNEGQFDAMTVGRLNMVETIEGPEAFYDALVKVSNFAFQSEATQYKLKFLQSGEMLVREGDTTQQVYIVKKGLLRAMKKSPAGSDVELGQIKVGEFVGEMAYFNEEARMASVEAVEDSELIEIQPATFEKVIYSRPSWAKTLISTLSKRLKTKSKT